VSWTPKYSAVFEERFIDNALAIIERDMQAALDYFYPGDGLDDFKERTLGQSLQTGSFPLLEIAPRSNAVTASGDEGRLIEAANIELRLAVTDSGPQAVTRKIMRYVRCLDAVIRSAPKSDWFAGMETQRRFGLVVEVEHGYDVVRTNGSIYFRAAVMLLTIKINER